MQTTLVVTILHQWSHNVMSNVITKARNPRHLNSGVWEDFNSWSLFILSCVSAQ